MFYQTLIFFFYFSNIFQQSHSLQLICDTKNETCFIKAPDLALDTDEPLQTNFSFAIESPENVTHIRFENSEVGEIPKIIFEKFINLQILEVKFCSLKRLKKASLANAYNLTEIDLSFNKLKRLEEGLFSNCKKLVSLNLFRNDIVEVNEKAFDGLDYLEKIVLSSNEVRRLKVNVFRFLPALTELDLKKNRIEDLGVVFQNLSQLEILELSFNKLKQLDKDVFFNMANLEILDLSNNRLENIHVDTFQTNLHLKALNLANNKFTSIDLKIYSASFKILDLQGNNLSEFNLTSGLVFAHSTNTSINVDHNSLDDFTIDPKVIMNRLSAKNNNFTSLNFLSKCCQDITWLDISHNPLVSESDDDQEPLSKSITHLSAQNISYENPSGIDAVIDIFWHTPKLKSVDISYNNFQGLDWTLLPKLMELTHMTAQNCSISNVDGLLQTFPALQTLVFNGNPLPCEEIQEKVNNNGKTIECHRNVIKSNNNNVK